MKYRKGLKLWWMVLALFAVASLLSACGMGRSAVLGKWAVGESGTSFEFTDAGKLVITSLASSVQEVDFQFQNDNTVKLPDGTVFTFKIEGKVLTLNVAGQQDIVLTRIW
jgi:hypothetical protein